MSSFLDYETLGIARARVAAHEINHMLTRSSEHSKYGLMRPALSRHDLLASRAPGWTDENRVATKR